MFKNKLVNVTDEIGVEVFLLACTTHLAEGRLKGRTLRGQKFPEGQDMGAWDCSVPGSDGMSLLIESHPEIPRNVSWVVKYTGMV